MSAERTFTLSDIVKIYNVRRHFVIHLVEKGIVKPLVDAKGRGKSRRYSYSNALEIGIFLHLNALNISHEQAHSILGSVSTSAKWTKPGGVGRHTTALPTRGRRRLGPTGRMPG